MKKINAFVAAGITAIAVLAAHPNRAQAAPTLNLPANALVVVIPTIPADSYLLTLVTNAPPGYDLSNGLFAAWCVDPYHPIRATNYTGWFYSTIDGPPAMPLDFQLIPWNAINYIINKKTNYITNLKATRADLQQAIYYFVLGAYFIATPSANTVAIVNDAVANGWTFVPGPGQKVAVISDFDLPPMLETVQELVLEIVIPQPPLAALSGYVYADLNNTGLFDAGDSPLGGVLVNLTGPTNLSTLTLPDGSYAFTNLPPGTYTVTETQPAGYLQGPNNLGQVNGSPNGQLGPGIDVQSQITLAGGQAGLAYNFGELMPVRLGDYVWLDANGNGLQDTNELGLNDVLVQLLDHNGAVIAATNTQDKSGQPGYYLFDNLAPGTYSVQFALPAGYAFTLHTQGADSTLDSDADLLDGKTAPLTLAQGESNLTLDAGLLPLSSLAGFVYFDANNDGNKDAGEIGIAATVTLTGIDDLGESVSLTTTSDATTGAYHFADLRPGTYTITETQPASYLDGKDTIGTPGGATANDQFTNIILPAGYQGLNNNFGELQPVTIGDFVWQDLNGDGLQNDGSASGLAGVKLTLTGTDWAGNAITTTTNTDRTGHYQFILPPGTYTVAVTTPAGFMPALAAQGTDAALDSNPTPSPTQTSPLPPGGSDLTIDFGFYLALTITCPPDAIVACTSNAPASAFTGTQGGWGAPPSGNNLGMLLQNNFASVYPKGCVEIGVPGAAGFSLKFTSAAAIQNFLPAGSTPAALSCDATNPTTTSAGVLAGQVLALQLNVDFGAKGFFPNQATGIGDLTYSDPASPLSGKTVRQILALANLALGGGNPGVTLAELNNVITALNEGFDEGAASAWTQVHVFSTSQTQTGNLDPSATGAAKVSGGCTEPTVTFIDVSTPDAAGNTLITRTWAAVDTCGNRATCSQTITVLKCSALYLACAADSGQAGLPYTSSLAASGGKTPYTFSIVAGSLPPGLTLNPSSGAITGTPTTPGTFAYSAKVIDSTSGTALIAMVDCGITIIPAACDAATFNFTGNTATSGTFGNIRTFTTTNGVSVKASAFSRVKNTGLWATAYLGSYAGGLGVTDTSEGSGANNQHTVGNLDRDNYVLFEFSQPVEVNRAFLGYVVSDSDLSVWVGNANNPFANHVTLSDAFLASLAYEENLTDTTSTRWASLNAQSLVGNILVIAAWTADTSPEDQFKIALLDICKPAPQITLNCPPITSGQAGVPFAASLVAGSGTPPYAFSLLSGSLPPGLNLATATGVISGTPTSPGTYSFTVKVADATAATATANCCLYIAPPAAQSCTLTIGYFKNHPAEITPLPILLGNPGASKTLSLTSLDMALAVLAQNVYGKPDNGITKLYAQLLAAKLNLLRGAKSTAIAAVLVNADNFLSGHDYRDWYGLCPSDQQAVLAWHAALDAYNNGFTGPGHCDDIDPTLPSPWCGADLGCVAPPGAHEYLNGLFTLAGSGADIGGTADACRFVSQSALGDCSILARVTSIQNTDASAKAGVMLRESLTPNAMACSVSATPGNRITMLYRTSTGAGAAKTTALKFSTPCWVKLVRSGSKFTGYASPDGKRWTAIATVTIPMAANVSLGLAVTSRHDGTLCTANFDSVTAVP